jgi:hypothetical protein
VRTLTLIKSHRAGDGQAGKGGESERFEMHNEGYLVKEGLVEREGEKMATRDSGPDGCIVAFSARDFRVYIPHPPAPVLPAIPR